MHCHACGERIEEESRFCRFCGAPQPVASPAEEAPPQEQSEATPTASSVALWIMGAVLVIGLLALLLSSQPHGSSPDSTGATVANAAADDTLMGNDVTSVDASAPPVPEANSMAEPAAPADPWSYHSSEDKVRGGQSYFASATSTNSVHLDFPYEGGSTLTMTVRHSPASDADVLLILSSGQLLCHSYDGCYATVRFDDKPAERVELSESADNSSDTVFVSDAASFIEKLKKAKKAIVELEIYQAGRPQFEFDVHGLKWQHRSD
jgi:hypothetical protein